MRAVDPVKAAANYQDLPDKAALKPPRFIFQRLSFHLKAHNRSM